MFDLKKYYNELMTEFYHGVTNISEETIMNVMVQRGCVNLRDHGLDEFNIHAIYVDIVRYFDEIDHLNNMAYIMKYMMGISNEKIRDYLYGPVDFRRVEKIYMNTSRKNFVQPEYTRTDFNTLGEILCNCKVHNSIEKINGSKFTVDEYKMYHLQHMLLYGDVLPYPYINDAINKIRPTEFININEFPWNMINKIINVDKVDSLRENKAIVDKICEYFKDKCPLDDMLTMKDELTAVVLYNVSRRVSPSEYIILRDKYLNNRSFTWISQSYNNVPTVSRIQQKHVNALKSLRFMLAQGNSLFDGFELLLSEDSVIIEKIINNNNLSPELQNAIHTLLPSSSGMLLGKMHDLVINNPLAYNVLVYGYNEGLVKTNQELKSYMNKEITMVLPKTIEELAFSPRTYNALKRAGINESSHLITYSISQLMNISNIGKVSLNEIITKLRMYDIYLKDYYYSKEEKK